MSPALQSNNSVCILHGTRPVELIPNYRVCMGDNGRPAAGMQRNTCATEAHSLCDEVIKHAAAL